MPSFNQLQNSEIAVQPSTPLSKVSTDNSETQGSSSEMVLCKGSHLHPKGPPQVPFTSLISSEIYRLIRKEGMTNIQLSRESLEQVWDKPEADPFVKLVHFSHGMTSAPQNLRYNLQAWYDISHQVSNIGGNSFEIGSLFALYLIAWTIYNCAEYGPLPNNSETILLLRQLNFTLSRDGAMELIDYCINIRETKSMSNFPLTPYFYITKLRWEFEIMRFMGDLDVAKLNTLLQDIAEVVKECSSFDHEWMEIDSFGARASALNLTIEIAICFEERIRDPYMFRSLKEKVCGNLKTLTEYFERHRSDIPIYDEAWLYSVQSKFYRINGADSQAHCYAKRAAHRYLECGRHWRALEEAEHTRDTNLIRYCQSACRAVRETQPPYYPLNTH